LYDYHYTIFAAQTEDGFSEKSQGFAHENISSKIISAYFYIRSFETAHSHSTQKTKYDIRRKKGGRKDVFFN